MMDQPTAGMLSATQYAADHPRCGFDDLVAHLRSGATMDEARTAIGGALASVLIQENGIRQPFNYTVTAKGLAAIGRA
jgi:hypothetical protein